MATKFLAIFFRFICICIFPTLTSYAQKSIQSRIFTNSDFECSLYNYEGLESDNGLLYFANENGVLEFDGQQWNLIKIKDYSGTFALNHINDTIFVGGFNQFGYIHEDSIGVMSYSSISDQLEEKSMFKEIWHIKYINDRIYFIANEAIFEYNDGQLNDLKLPNSIFFDHVGKILVHNEFNGFGYYRNDSVEYFNSNPVFENDFPYKILPFNTKFSIAATFENGLFLLNNKTLEFSKWDAEAARHFIEENFNGIQSWEDSLYLCPSFDAGLMIFNKKGEIVKQYLPEKYQLPNALRFVFKDKRQHTWVVADYGICYFKDAGLKNDFVKGLRPTIRGLTADNIVLNKSKSIILYKEPSIIKIDYALIGFFKEEVEYSYKLEGQNNTWSTWANKNNELFENLDFGSYTFKVKARNKEGEESEEAGIEFLIFQPWYLSFYFKIYLVLILLALILIVTRYRTNHLKEANLRLEDDVAKRTRDLQASNEQLILRNQELDNFVYRSSHDLVAPLKSMKGLINIALRENEQESMSQYLSLMLTSTSKLEHFIGHIMEYNTNLKSEVVKEGVNLRELIEDIISDLQFYTNIEKIQFSYHLNDVLGDITTDKKRLRMVLSNLITNSIKYLDYKKPNPSITFTRKSNDNEDIISINDNGTGIDEDYLEQIFDMFFRASTLADGSGLGLYIVKDTVDKMGGEITATSKIHIGTTFTIILPKTENPILSR